MAVDSDARTQLGNVLSVLPKKLNKFNPAAGYDFSSEIPIMENLFGISDADMSYVSVKDALGALSWQAVGGDDGTGIKKFDSPVGYDFKSETPSAKNLIGVSDDGLSYLSVESAGGGAGGAQVPVGPTTFDMNLLGGGLDDWGSNNTATFTYKGLDVNGYPYWEEGTHTLWKVEWFADFTSTIEYGMAPLSSMWGYVLTYNGTIASVASAGYGAVCNYGQPFPSLPAGEFWDLRDSSNFTYTSVAGDDTSVEIPNDATTFAPANFNGTETAGSGGGGSSLTWQAIGGGGGGFGESAAKGGPIFITGAYSSAGAVAREGDLQYGAVWTGMSTPEDAVEVSLLIERGDSQQFKPTGVYYYQTGQSSELPNESSPQYLSPDLLTLSDNGYSWEVDTEISTADSIMLNDTAYYLFFNGERNTEVEIKRSTLPTVSNAVFVNQATNSLYPLIGAVGAGFTTPDGTTNFDQMQQSAVKNGDTVQIMLECDKPLSSVLFSSSNGIILDTEFVLPPLVNGESGWPYQASIAGIWTIVFQVAVNNVNSIDSNGTFEIKVKDLQGNLSEFWHGSNNVIAINNSSPTFSLALDSLLNSAEAISPSPDDPATYTVNGSDLTNEDFFQFDLTDSSEAELHSSHAWGNEQVLQDGAIVLIGAAASPSLESTLSPFSMKVLRLTNGTLFESGPSPSVMVQGVDDPTFSVNVDAVRSGPGAGHEDEITITSNVSLLALYDNGAIDVFGDGTVTSGSDSVIKIDAKNWKIKVKSLDSAAREVPFDVVINWEKYSSDGGSSIVSSQVRGFVQREISKNGVEALSEIPIGATVVNSAKIKSKSGLMGNLTLKVNSGNEANVPFNSAVSSSSLGGGVGAEFGLSVDSSSAILDSDARAQWSPTVGSTVYITLEELI